MLGKGIDGFFRMLFPHLCVCCQEHSIPRTQLLCITCLADMPYTDHFTIKENKVVQHFYGRLPIRHAASLLYFNKTSRVQNMLHKFKYEGDFAIGHRLAEEMAQQFMKCYYFGNIDLILPIPISKEKRKERGFNQTEILGQKFAEIVQLPYKSNILNKIKDTESQTSKTRSERELNVKDSVSVSHTPSIMGKSILLVDDLITTGATAAASGVALLAHGCSSVSLVTAGSATDTYL